MPYLEKQIFLYLRRQIQIDIWYSDDNMHHIHTRVEILP